MDLEVAAFYVVLGHHEPSHYLKSNMRSETDHQVTRERGQVVCTILQVLC